MRSLATPANYGFAGQDLVYGSYTARQPRHGAAERALPDQRATGSRARIELLATITNPRIVVPHRSWSSTRPIRSSSPTRRAPIWSSRSTTRSPARRPSSPTSPTSSSGPPGTRSDLLPPVRANLPARAGDRRRPAAHVAQAAARTRRACAAGPPLRLPVAVQPAAAGGQAISRRAGRARSGRDGARLRRRPAAAPIRCTTGRSSITCPCSSPPSCCRTSSSRTP